MVSHFKIPTMTELLQFNREWLKKKVKKGQKWLEKQ